MEALNPAQTSCRTSYKFKAYFKNGFVKGHDFSRAEKDRKTEGL
jgi:hypothetical protein